MIILASENSFITQAQKAKENTEFVEQNERESLQKIEQTIKNVLSSVCHEKVKNVLKLYKWW